MNVTEPKQIGARIRELRTDLGFSQREFASFTGVGKSRISDYENGKSPHLENLARIAKTNSVSVDWLVFG